MGAAPASRRRATAPPLALSVLAAAAVAGGCGEQSSRAAGVTARAPRTSAVPVVSPAGRVSPEWTPIATVAGQAAAWEAERSGVTLLRFDQSLLRLALHAGMGEPSGSWRFGDRIGPSEIHRVVAAFNGGFKFETGVVGYSSEGRTPVALRPGRGSIVTYRDGTTQIGSWEAGVPARGRPIASVLQNLSLLIDRGRAAESVEGCILSCWGATVGGVSATARSALGIDGSGRLVWAAGENLRPSDLARGLISAGVLRAVELDINPDWVAGYLYVHSGGGPRAVPLVPGQFGIAGRLLAPYARDFFTVTGR